MTPDELLSTEYRDALKAHHAVRLSDTIYREGFDSECTVNPYTFEVDLDFARMTLSCKKGPLTASEKLRLSSLNAEMEATPWARWSAGHHARNYDFLVDAPAPFPSLRAMVERIEKITEEAYAVYTAEVQAIANKHGVPIATGHMSDFWQVKKPRARKWLCELWDEHPVLTELKALDKVAIEIRIGPTNMMLFEPVKQ